MGFMNNNRNCNHDHKEDKTIVSPTETIVNTRTNVRTIRHIHPTEVINVNRNVIRNEHFYPVTQREVNETVVEDFDCGNDVNNPRCRPKNNRPRPRWI